MKKKRMVIPIILIFIGVLSLILAYLEWKKKLNLTNDLDFWERAQALLPVGGALLFVFGALIVFKVNNMVSHYTKLDNEASKIEGQKKDDSAKAEIIRAFDEKFNESAAKDRLNSESQDQIKRLEHQAPTITSLTITDSFKKALEFQNSGDAKNAISLYSEIIRKTTDLNSTEGLIVKGSAHINLGLIKSTIEFDINSALTEFSKAEEIYNKIKDKNRLASVYLNQARVYEIIGKNNEAMFLDKKAIDIYTETKNIEDHSTTLNNIGITLRSMGNLTESIQSFEEAIEIANGLQPLTSEIQLNLGISLMNNDQLDEASDIFVQIVTSFSGTSNKILGYALGNLGLIEATSLQFKSALSYHQRALGLFKDIQDRRGIANETANVGNMLGHLGSFDEAKTDLLAAIKLHSEIPYQFGLATDYALLGTLYLNQRGNKGVTTQTEGIEHLQHAKAIFVDIGNMSQAARIDDILSRF